MTASSSGAPISARSKTTGDFRELPEAACTGCVEDPVVDNVHRVKQCIEDFIQSECLYCNGRIGPAGAAYRDPGYGVAGCSFVCSCGEELQQLRRRMRSTLQLVLVLLQVDSVGHRLQRHLQEISAETSEAESRGGAARLPWAAELSAGEVGALARLRRTASSNGTAPPGSPPVSPGTADEGVFSCRRRWSSSRGSGVCGFCWALACGFSGSPTSPPRMNRVTKLQPWQERTSETAPCVTSNSAVGRPFRNSLSATQSKMRWGRRNKQQPRFHGPQKFRSLFPNCVRHRCESLFKCAKKRRKRRRNRRSCRQGSAPGRLLQHGLALLKPTDAFRERFSGRLRREARGDFCSRQQSRRFVFSLFVAACSIGESTEGGRSGCSQRRLVASRSSSR